MRRCYLYDLADDAVVTAAAPAGARVERGDGVVAVLVDDADVQNWDRNQPRTCTGLYTVEDGAGAGLVAEVPADKLAALTGAKSDADVLAAAKALQTAAIDAAAAAEDAG